MAEWGNLCFCFLTISVFDNLSAIGLIAVSQPPVAVTHGCFDACGWWNDPQLEDLNSFPLLPRLILNMEFQNGSRAMSYIINPTLSYSSISVTMTHSFEFHVEVERWYVQQLANPSAHVTVGDRWKCHAGYLNSRSWTFSLGACSWVCDVGPLQGLLEDWGVLPKPHACVSEFKLIQLFRFLDLAQSSRNI